MQQLIYHSAIHLKRCKIKNGMLNFLILLRLLQPACWVVTRSITWQGLFPQTFQPMMSQIPFSLCTVLYYLIQAQHPWWRDIFGQLPHLCLHWLPMVHNNDATVFISVLVAVSHPDFQMLARLEEKIAMLLKMCGCFLKMLHPRGVVFFTSRSYAFWLCNMCLWNVSRKQVESGMQQNLSMFTWTTSSGILRCHLFENHIASWIAGCDKLNIPITAKSAQQSVMAHRECQGFIGTNVPELDTWRSFSHEAFVDVIVRFIVADDQVFEKRVLSLIMSLTDFRLVHKCYWKSPAEGSVFVAAWRTQGWGYPTLICDSQPYIPGLKLLSWTACRWNAGMHYKNYFCSMIRLTPI